jgi:hypothetical protein
MRSCEAIEQPIEILPSISVKARFSRGPDRRGIPEASAGVQPGFSRGSADWTGKGALGHFKISETIGGAIDPRGFA